MIGAGSMAGPGRGPRRLRRAAPLLVAMVVVVFGSGLGACSKGGEDEAGTTMPAPVSQAEVERGLAACQDYIEKVCACAEARPGDAALGELCHLAPAKLSSLAMAAEVNHAPREAVERAATERTIRRIVRSCIEGMVELAPRGCPR
jgi:hypothetical protein